MRIGTVLFASLLPLLSLAAPQAQAESVVLLATRSVPDHSDTDTIELPGSQTFRDVRLCVGNRSVNFHDLDIYFANGGHQDVSMRTMINPGECTRWIDLAGDGMRNITRIVMSYDAISGGAQAVVSVYGRF